MPAAREFNHPLSARPPHLESAGVTRPARALRCPRGALFRTSSCNPRAVRGRRSCRIACRMFRRSTLERARSFHRPGRARAHPRHAKDGSSKVRERGWQPGSRRTVWAKVARQVSMGRGVIEVCPLPCLAKAVPPQCTCDGGCPTNYPIARNSPLDVCSGLYGSVSERMCTLRRAITSVCVNQECTSCIRIAM